MSKIAGNQVRSQGVVESISKHPSQRKAGRTTKEIMNDEIAAFENKVKQAAQALDGTIGIVAWYEVESVYRLKRLLEGLTALDIYRLVAPATRTAEPCTLN